MMAVLTFPDSFQGPEEYRLGHFPEVLAEEAQMDRFQVFLAEGNIVKLPFRCRNCGKQYKHSATMTRHRKQCEGRYHLFCPICAKPFHRRDRYQEHLAHKHATQDVQ